MSKQIPVSDAARADLEADGGLHEVLGDLAYQRLAIVNCVLLSDPPVLIDAGLAATGAIIRRAAERRWGRAVAPEAIVLTHGHFDHVGALESLLEDWPDVPVYAHTLEHPYLDGRESYPPPDPSVGGGAMSALSALYPRGPIDVSTRLRALPEDGSIPAMPGWRWIATPGHSPGHVSLWREADATLVSGDAVITTRQESAYAVAVQETELHGPPAYFTTDWTAAAASARALAALEPRVLVTGHGRALQGPEMLGALRALAEHFETVAVPRDGRYVREPVRVEPGGEGPSTARA